MCIWTVIRKYVTGGHNVPPPGVNRVNKKKDERSKKRLNYMQLIMFCCPRPLKFREWRQIQNVFEKLFGQDQIWSLFSYLLCMRKNSLGGNKCYSFRCVLSSVSSLGDALGAQLRCVSVWCIHGVCEQMHLGAVSANSLADLRYLHPASS